MQKDYYKILQLPPHASIPEIRQAYRRLAMLYHPDKNNNEPYSAQMFNDVKEAHDVLTNPAKKENYLQERWYNQSLGKRRTAETITPVSILKLCLEFEKYASTLDIHRLNREGLAAYGSEILSSDTINVLIGFKDGDINRQIIATSLSAIKPLSSEMAKPILDQLVRLAGSDDQALELIYRHRIYLRKGRFWARYKVLVILLSTVLICLLIYFTSR